METINALPKPIILNATELKHEIMKLDYLREEQETVLKTNIKEIYYSLQFSTIIRNTVKDLNEDAQLKKTIVTKGIELGSNFLLDQLMIKKGSGIKNYLVNTGLKKIVSIILSRKKKNISEKVKPE